ncbi:MAG: MBL fold metallo-hydrolase [Candidatus Poribacteria bacterium]
MTDTEKLSNNSTRELVFLGTSGCIQVPAFFCECATCAAARRNGTRRRTRAGVALLGDEIVLIDAGPDLEHQLERERIRRPERIFITHWHFDHIAGLGAFGEPSSIYKWPAIEIYVPRQVAHHFDEELAYMRNCFNIHPIEPGVQVELPDGTWEVVKTTHTEHSVGFIVDSSRRFAYLIDGVVPPPETLQRLSGCDILIVEATMDELDENHWVNFSVSGAIDFWRQTGIRECFLTHLSCHSWRNKSLVAGISDEERASYENKESGLRFAYDGMRIVL